MIAQEACHVHRLPDSGAMHDGYGESLRHPIASLLRDCLIDAALPAPDRPAAGEWASPMQGNVHVFMMATPRLADRR